jgi:signal peptidase I
VSVGGRLLTPFDRRPPRPWLAALLSFLQTGLGHSYAGAPRTGAAWWLAAQIIGLAVVALASRVSGRIPLIIVVGFVVAVPVVVATHAWRVARSNENASISDRRGRVLPVLGFFVVGVLAGVALRAAVRRYIMEAYRIPSSSMEPTILSGDWLFVVPSDARSVRRDAVIVYRHEGTPLLKRAVALAGDTIAMEKGHLLRNGRAVAEPYVQNDSSSDYADRSFDWQSNFLVDQSHGAGYAPTRDGWGPLVVPPRTVFVLGDNRHNSNDSRFSGFVAMSDVVGHPTEVYFSWSSDSSAVRWNRIGVGVR